MPYLFCEEHGQAREADSRTYQEHYDELGESVLIVSGRLKTGPWLCDRCNATIPRGGTAYLVTGFPRWIVESVNDYDFGYERGYFPMKGEERIAVYGAHWPAVQDESGAIRAPRRRADRPQKRRPIYAVELFPEKVQAALLERPKQLEPED